MTQKPDNPPAMMTNEQMAAAVARVKELDAKRLYAAQKAEDNVCYDCAEIFREQAAEAAFQFQQHSVQMAALIDQLWDEREHILANYVTRTAYNAFVDKIEQQRAVMVQVRDALDSIVSGNYHKAVSKVKSCPHGIYSWDACENCMDIIAVPTLAALNDALGGE